MSKTTTKINKIKKKLDSISGLEDKVILSYIDNIDFYVSMVISEIDLYLKDDPLNGTIFKH